MTTRYFLYEKVSKHILCYCDKFLGRWCLGQADPSGDSLALGWKQTIRHPPAALVSNPITITYVYPHDNTSAYHAL